MLHWEAIPIFVPLRFGLIKNFHVKINKSKCRDMNTSLPALNFRRFFSANSVLQLLILFSSLPTRTSGCRNPNNFYSGRRLPLIYIKINYQKKRVLHKVELLRQRGYCLSSVGRKHVQAQSRATSQTGPSLFRSNFRLWMNLSSFNWLKIN